MSLTINVCLHSFSRLWGQHVFTSKLLLDISAYYFYNRKEKTKDYWKKSRKPAVCLIYSEPLWKCPSSQTPSRVWIVISFGYVSYDLSKLYFLPGFKKYILPCKCLLSKLSKKMVIYVTKDWPALHLTAGSACVFKTSRSVQVFPRT